MSDKIEEVFKVGDKVECVDIDNNASYKKYKGKEGVIERITDKQYEKIGKHLLHVKWYDSSLPTQGMYGKRFKLATNKPTQVNINGFMEETMDYSDNFAEVFDGSAKLAKKMAARFGKQYGGNDRDLIALERDKGKLIAILEREEDPKEYFDPIEKKGSSRT